MLQSLYNSISGIKSQQIGIDNTGNNIANVNTIGFKNTQTEFETIFSKSIDDGFLNATTDDIGLGGAVASTSLDMRQGSFQTTDKNFDLAIAGDGWFNISDGKDIYFTRAGNFSTNKDGLLVNPDGYFVQGFDFGNVTNEIIDPTIEPSYSGSLTNLTIPKQLTYPASPTTEVTLKKNLQVGTTFQKQSIGIINPNGDRKDLIIEFTPTNPQPQNGKAWDYTTYIDGSSNQQTGTLYFDTEGGLISETILTIDNEGTPLSFDLGHNFSGVISIDGESDTSVISDGRPQGYLKDYHIDSLGNIIASFDNSTSASIGKVVISHFQNDQGLEKIGNTLFKESLNSGKSKLYIDENGNFTMGSSIQSNRLENSNVNLSISLTNLIVMQKAFDANAKGITTSDQMLQTAINLKK